MRKTKPIRADEFLEMVSAALKKEKEVRITNLGVFRVKHMEAREGMNPKTGERIHIKARDRVAFRAAKKFKEAVL